MSLSRFIPILLLVSCASCAPYAQVQLQLVEQAQRGVSVLEQSLQNKSRIVAQQHAARRQRLDDAFDADVRNRAAQEQLDAEWIVEHRRAYAAAVDALVSARLASIRADEVDARNVEATRAALERLRWLQSIQLRLSSLGTRAAGRESDHEHD